MVCKESTYHIMSSLSLFPYLPCIHPNTHLVLNILIKSSVCVHDKERCWREESYYISILHQGHEIFKFSSRNRKLRINEVVLKMAQKKNMRECYKRELKVPHFATKLSKNNLSLFCFDVLMNVKKLLLKLNWC